MDLSLVTEKSNATDAPGLTCYRVMPRYAVTNIGQAPAAGFSTKLECKPGPGVGWHLYASHNLTLNPGQSFTVEPNVNTMISWCEGYGYKAVGFRVTADDGNIIAESREGNNTAEKLFPSMPIPGLKPELIEKKGR
ncbi:MAG: hypothetical protein MUF69_03735 [Desulfobacterota bacterium]|nr:hypothetical protein [Thermodesulfobacteriota bacterium]